MKGQSVSVINMNIEMLDRVILYVRYNQYIKGLSMSIASMTMELLGRISLLGKWNQFIKEWSVAEIILTLKYYLDWSGWIISTHFCLSSLYLIINIYIINV